MTPSLLQNLSYTTSKDRNLVPCPAWEGPPPLLIKTPRRKCVQLLVREITETPPDSSNHRLWDL